MIILLRIGLVTAFLAGAVWLLIDYNLLVFVGGKLWTWTVFGFKASTKWLTMNFRALMTRTFAGKLRKWLIGLFLATGLVDLLGSRRAGLIYAYFRLVFRRFAAAWRGLTGWARIAIIVAVAVLTWLLSGNMLLFLALGFLIDRILFVPRPLKNWLRRRRLADRFDRSRRLARARYIRGLRRTRPKLQRSFDRLLESRKVRRQDQDPMKSLK